MKKEQLIKLHTARRHIKPCYLQHYGINRGARKINCDAGFEAMIHSSWNALIKKDSKPFYMPSRPYKQYSSTRKKFNQIHHMLLQRFKEIEGEDNSDTLEVLLPPIVAA
jgi:hypothetical protein